MTLRTFPADPLVRRPDPEGEWELCETLDIFDGEKTFRVPKGFTTDLASIPRIVRPLIETADLGIVAPLAHDALYRSGGMGLYDRRGADRLFLGLMTTEGVAYWRRMLAYRAVRWFGAAAWRG